MNLKSITARYVNASVHNGALTVSSGTLVQDTKSGNYGTIEAYVRNGNLNIKNTNTGNIKAEVKRGSAEITVSSSTFNGLFSLTSSSNSISVGGDGQYTVSNKDKGDVEGTIGNTVSGTQTIEALGDNLTLTVNS